jgi:hypothetical protein
MEEKKIVKVLIVGDWVVDENWILTKYESETSSHVGLEHYRSLVDNVDAQILSLCGAGNVARSLHGMSVKEKPEKLSRTNSIQVYGLGLWHPKDTKLLSSLFSNDIIANQTPLTLGGMVPTIKSGTERYSLCGKHLEQTTCQDIEGGDCEAGKDRCNYLKTLYKDEFFRYGTMRVVRLYKLHTEGYPVNMFRADWQSPHHFEHSNESINELEQNLWDGISAIVVHDLHKGFVSKRLIHSLVNKYPNAKWFVRTKDMHVDWIDVIPEDKFLLRVIGAEYVPERSKTKRWFYGKELNIEAVKELKEFGKFDQIQQRKAIERWVVAIHKNNSLIALYKEKNGTKIKGYLIVDVPPPQPINVGRSSIVFASCVAAILGCYEDNSGRTMLERAIYQAFKWTQECTEGFRAATSQQNGVSSSVYSLRGDHINAIKSEYDCNENEILCHTKEIDVDTEIHSWDRSFKEKGIVGNAFHIWRGFSCIKGYIAIRNDLRDELNKLYSAIHRFRGNPNIKNSLNCLFLGNPGWGKSFLAEKISENFDFHPLLFNLAQLTSPDQVIDCFDAISSIQNQPKNRPVLIFFDEIDSKIGGYYTFPLFLAPILDGTYRRGGRTFYLAPSLWIFAVATNPFRLEDATKTADFMSRINGPIVQLDFSSGHQPASSKTEQVYLGVQLLRVNNSDVSAVSKDVLQIFHDLEMKHGVRSLEQTIRKFRNVQYGKVGRNTLPEYHEISSLIDIDKELYKSVRESKERETFIDLIDIPK